MARSYNELMQLKEYAQSQGITMSELGRRGGKRKSHKKEKEIVHFSTKKKFEQLQFEGLDWWND